MELTKQQQDILNSSGKKVVVSASAGSGKTFVLVEKLISLICDRKVPASRLLVLTFTKAAAKEMKSRLLVSMLAQKPTDFILQQIDDLSVSDISTIDSFCEKIIKRNISKLDIDEGFSILDERAALSLKSRAFQSAFEKFSTYVADFEEVYFAFKKNKEKLQECIFDMQSYFDSISNDSDFRVKLTEGLREYNQRAKEFLLQKMKGKILGARNYLSKAEIFADAHEKGLEFAANLKSQLNIDFGADFYQVCSQINEVIIPDLPRNKMDAEFKKLIVNARDLCRECKIISGNYNNISGEDAARLDAGALSAALVKLYNIYYEKYSSFKNRRGVLDFADIEKYAYKLLQDEDIKKSLQEKYDYIFIDEYQDTNRLQESILKPIAEGGYFTAVGDIKQGIYAFRNANKEIMLQDIAEFSASEDGQALYLTGNFRTDDKILSFVNDVFEKIMTIESSGIDYKDKSKLVGLQKFEPDNCPAVSVDIICSQEKKEKVERSGIYSVEGDALSQEDKFDLELDCIETRINEVLATEIYDAKNKKYRKVGQSDIALLFRNRSPLMKECVRRLQQRGFAVEADIKNNLLEDGQIRFICALLKLALNLQDDISLASAMSSVVGGFSMQELAALRQTDEESNFYEIILNSTNQKVCDFLKRFEEFTFQCQVFGITKALQNIFNSTGYYEYLKTLVDGREKLSHINQLFKMIKESDCDFKIATVISMLEQNTKQKTAQDGSVDAITITTIHATKGLEYPIVILCGCGENLNKVYNKNYLLSDMFGLGTVVYNFDEDTQQPSPAFLAGKLKKAKEEFESELMIFYVALTRAQNHLYIIGSGQKKNYTFEAIENQNNYLKLIMYALGENLTEQLFEQGEIVTPNRRIQIVGEVENITTEIIKNSNNNQKLLKNQEKIKKYQDFSYKNKNYCKINFKNSVTGILNLEKDDKFEKEINLINIDSEEKNKLNSTDAIKMGNAYHEALKLIDMSKINSYENFEKEFLNIIPLMTDEYCNLINKNTLYNNIVIINSLIKNQKIFKEQEFLLKASITDLGLGEENDFVIIQGIIDFFAIGEKNILIDFKFTSVRDEEKIKNRYKKQIDLYSHAIEKAFKIKLNEKYLLSLKHGKLIKM